MSTDRTESELKPIYGSGLVPGAQPGLHLGGSNFHEISFDDVIVLLQPWYKFFANGHI